MDSYVTTIDEDKDLELKKVVKKRKLRKSNKKSFNIDSFIFLIDNENIGEVKKLINNIKNNENDILFEMYKNNLLTIERLQFIMKYCTKYLNISSKLIKKLIKDRNATLLDVIFSHLKFYDNDLILQLLFLSTYKTAISSSDLNHLISNEKFKILLSTNNIEQIHRNFLNNPSKNVYKYLINECKRKDINIYIIKYLIEHGVDNNKIITCDGSPLYIACGNGNKTVIKYLIKQGTDINKENWNGEIPLFKICKRGNKDLVKYLVEKYQANVNKKSERGETPLFNACLSGNETLVKYLLKSIELI